MPPFRQRMLEKLKTAAAERAAKRLRREWDAYRHPPEVRTGWFRRRPGPVPAQNFRSLVQVNFYRTPRE